MQNLYFLWSLERVAVLYDLPAIGDKDWYRWGAEILVANQDVAGNWIGGMYPGNSPILDTCLALLFLQRANLVKDLTSRLPFKPDDLNNGVMEKLTPPPAKKTEEPIEKATLASEPAKPSKPAEPDNLISKPIGQLAGTTATPDTTSERPANSSKKGIVLSLLLLFVVLIGGGLIFFLVFVHRQKKDEDEEAEDHPPRKSKGANKKRKSKSMASGRDSRT